MTTTPTAPRPAATRTRSIRLTIMTGFVGLLLLTSVPIIGYMHVRSTNALLQLADELMQGVSDAIIERTASYLAPASAMAKMNARLAESGTLSLRPNTNLEARAIAMLRQYPQLAMFNMADEKGNFLMPKKMPDGSIATKCIDRDAVPPHVTWTYRDPQGAVVRTETSEEVTYDPRTRPWYQGAKSTGDTHWTDMYILFTDQVPGITNSCPVLDQQGQFAGAFGIDIELGAMSRFLQTLRIGNSGIAFVFNEKDEVVAYPDAGRIVRKRDGKLSPARLGELGEPKITHCLETHRATGESRFVFEAEGTSYIGSVVRFPNSLGNDWRIGMVVPRDDFIGALRDTARYTLWVAVAILLASLVMASLLARSISGPVVALAEEARKIQSFQFDSEAKPDSRIREIQELQSSLASTRVALSAFGKYVPKELVRQLVHRGQAARIGGQREELTVFFSDIAGFTPISEGLAPEELMAHLSEYLDQLTRTIAEHKGTVDKFIGDAVMAFWGAPTPEPDHAYLACLAALRCQEQVRALNTAWVADGRTPLPTRIGIHTGDVIVGNVGSAERMNYSVLGDTVNVASRLEGAGKIYGASIIVGETAYQETADRLIYRPLDKVAVLGRKQGLMIYELMGEKGSPIPEGAAKLCDDSADGLEAYLRRDWQSALAVFSELRNSFPEDKPAALFVERCQALLADPPGDDWDGTTRLEAK